MMGCEIWDAPGVKHVVSISISQGDQRIASSSIFPPAKATADLDNIKVSGHINGTKRSQSELLLEWSYPTLTQTGDYRCDMFVIYEDGHPGNISLSLEVKGPTIQDLIKLLLEQQEINKKQEVFNSKALMEITTQKEVNLKQQQVNTKLLQGSCIDVHSSCAEWARNGVCETSPTFMSAYCKRSCNKCYCNGGFVEHGDYCYALIERSETWVSAAANCRALDAYLAEPRNKEENDFVKQLAKSQTTTPTHVWLGGHDQVTEGKWFWGHSGAPVEGFTDWHHDGQPNNANGGEDCMEYRLNFKSWNDMKCNQAQHFICQKGLSTDLTG